MMKTKLSDILTKEIWDRFGDLDVVNDVTDEMTCAWCGNVLTEDGKERFKDVLSLDAEVYFAKGFDENVICVNVGKEEKWERAWKKACELFEAMSGYCTEEEYNKWFRDDLQDGM